jgi:hypothetical protein
MLAVVASEQERELVKVGLELVRSVSIAAGETGQWPAEVIAFSGYLVAEELEEFGKLDRVRGRHVPAASGNQFGASQRTAD